MARIPDDLPERFPIGTKYIVESRGSVVHRFVELPDGRKISLPSRKAIPCSQAERNRCEARSKRARAGYEGLMSTLPY